MVLEGTLYARYYDLPKADDPALASPEEPPAGRGRRWSKPTAEPFAALCRDRAREADAPRRRRARRRRRR
jgi:hypothetical protein